MACETSLPSRRINTRHYIITLISSAMGSGAQATVRASRWAKGKIVNVGRCPLLTQRAVRPTFFRPSHFAFAGGYLYRFAFELSPPQDLGQRAFGPQQQLTAYIV